MFDLDNIQNLRCHSCLIPFSIRFLHQEVSRLATVRTSNFHSDFSFSLIFALWTLKKESWLVRFYRLCESLWTLRRWDREISHELVLELVGPGEGGHQLDFEIVKHEPVCLRVVRNLFLD